MDCINFYFLILLKENRLKIGLYKQTKTSGKEKDALPA